GRRTAVPHPRLPPPPGPPPKKHRPRPYPGRFFFLVGGEPPARRVEDGFHRGAGYPPQLADFDGRDFAPIGRVVAAVLGESEILLARLGDAERERNRLLRLFKRPAHRSHGGAAAGIED